MKHGKHYIIVGILILLAIFVIALFFSFIQTPFKQDKTVKIDYRPIVNIQGAQAIPEPQDNGLVKILVIEGGGALGIIPLHVLVYLEKETGQPISHLFNLIVATSTGAMIAAGLTQPVSIGSKTPQYTAEQVLDFYNKSLPYIFSRDLKYRLSSLWGINGPLYDQAHLATIIHRYYNSELLMKQLITPVLFPAYAIDKNGPVFFTSFGENSTFYVTDILQGVTSAPGIFPPTAIQCSQHTIHYTVIDGGIYDDNPVMTALLQAMVLYPGKRYLIIDLGTGTTAFEFSYQEARSWSALNWLFRIIKFFHHSSIKLSDRQVTVLSQVFQNKIEYYDISFLSPLSQDAFTGNKAQLEKLNRVGDMVVRDNQALLNKLALKLR